MRMRWVGGWSLVMLVGLAGCRSQVATTTPETPPEDTTTHLSDHIDISLENWLKLSRPELAKLAEEWTVTVGKHREAARGNPEGLLLPGLHPPAASVVFSEARYSTEADFSLPPYLKAGQKDAAAALHLARFGDREAALKLADPDDKELLAKLDACRGERDYPLEWSRLVGLVLENAQLRLVGGEPDGAAELVQLHKQLRAVLDAKTAAGPLGAALLPRGRQALSLAAAAWREPRLNKTALAADVDSALADWGKLPEAVPGLSIGAAQAEVTRLFGAAVEGQAVVANSGPAVQRALDLLALPLPGEGVTDVIAFVDNKQALTEVLLLYRAKINELFPEPRLLALPLVEQGCAAQTATAGPGLSRQSWTDGERSYEVALLTRGRVGGAVARLGKAGAAASAVVFNREPRDFGAVSLDRSFEQNRLRVAPEQAGNLLEIKDKATLGRFTSPASRIALASAALQREASEDLVSMLVLRWAADQNSDALSRLAVPLWAAYGPAAIASAEDKNGGQFLLSWEDGKTRLKLCLPFDEQAPALVAEDSRGPAALKERAEAAAQLDQRERRERIAAGKAQTRLARFIRLPAHGIDDVRLGQTREQVKALLPSSRSIRVQGMPDGFNVLFMSEPPATASYWPRQLFIRFGSDERVAEIRVRYQDGPHAAGPGSPALLDTLKAKPNGAPETLPAPWAGLWTDLGGRKAPVLYRWRDDTTCLTYQHDRGGSEVVLRDCPPEQPQGVALKPLRFCSSGIAALALGHSLPDVRQRWHVSGKPLLAANGAEVLVPPAKSRYDVVLVWYDNNKVTRLIARHREPKGLKPAEVGTALQKAWAEDIDHLGYIRRQDGPAGQVLQAYSWNDDQTRVRMFAQETAEGVRLFTEWRAWPIPAQTLAAK